MMTMRKVTVGIAAMMIGAATVRPDHCSSEKQTSASPCPYTSEKMTSTKTGPSKKDLVALAAGAEEFKTLVAAVKAAGLVEVLQGDGPFTVFAPTDAAFAKLPEGTLESLLKPENRDKLVAILKYHVVPGRVMAADVKTMKAPTANGQKVNIKVTDDGVFVDKAKVVKTDLLAENGVIHVIDAVILPQS